MASYYAKGQMCICLLQLNKLIRWKPVNSVIKQLTKPTKLTT